MHQGVAGTSAIASHRVLPDRSDQSHTESPTAQRDGDSMCSSALLLLQWLGATFGCQSSRCSGSEDTPQAYP